MVISLQHLWSILDINSAGLGICVPQWEEHELWSQTGLAPKQRKESENGCKYKVQRWECRCGCGELEGFFPMGLNSPCGVGCKVISWGGEGCSEMREQLLCGGEVTNWEESFQHSPVLKFSRDLCQIQVLVPKDQKLFINRHKAKWQEAGCKHGSKMCLVHFY